MALVSKEYSLTLLKRTVIAKNVLELRFSKPQGFVFQGGQFLQFKIPWENGEVLRSYSIASGAHEPFLDFCLKVLPNGKASIFLSELEIGKEVKVLGPEGHFVIKETHAPHKICIATGTGLAPIISIVPAALALPGLTTKLEVLFGVRSEADVFWLERLKNYDEMHAQFSYQVTLSRPDQPTAWQGLVGRVTAHIPHHHVEAEYYLCGSLEMVKDVRKILVDKGVPMKQIHFEIF